MIVVSDTSPLTALLTVGEADLLLKLFDEVIVPEAVRNELLRGHPTIPVWLRVQAVKNHAEVARFAQTLDNGEAEAIELAKELRADRLLMDERKGRRVASQEGIQVIGLLGVVILAKRRQLIPSARTLRYRLEQESGVYLSEDLKNTALRTVGE
jgi:uncharacterized protein